MQSAPRGLRSHSEGRDIIVHSAVVTDDPNAIGPDTEILDAFARMCREAGKDKDLLDQAKPEIWAKSVMLTLFKQVSCMTRLPFFGGGIDAT